jgi:hypothetical protein
MRLYRVAVVILLLAVTSLAQDPLKTLPKAYKLQFENDWVKVVRVHYGPREKLPAHEHTQTASAYVYLNDSGPVVFKHLALPYGDVTRPPTKTGTVRLYRGLDELHEVENKSDLPSDFLRVEFKTEPVNDKSLKGRYHREQYTAGENFQKVQFENEQVRITRLVCAAGKRIDVSTSSTEPTLVIALTQAQFSMVRSRGKNSKLKLVPGDPSWIDVNQQAQLENTGIAPAELLRFEFKTKPLSKEALQKKKKHEHPKN